MLDAGAFYAGTLFLSSPDTRFYTTEAVFAETKHIKSRYAALEALVDLGKLRIVDPERSFVDMARAAARRTGDNAVLSAADVSVIALALQLKTALVTDDYSAANVASDLKVPVIPATPGREIKETRKWISYCSACGRAFGPDAKECALCGNRLKRKYKKAD